MAISYTALNLAVKEDLLDILKNLSPTETQLLSGLGDSTAKDVYHISLVDTLNAVKVNAHVEGTDATYHGVSNPARVANYTQIFKQGFQVSDTERAVDTAAFNDRFTYESGKAMKLIKNDMEYALMRGSLISSNGTVAGQLRGIKNSLSLVTSQSGVSLTEAILNDYFELVWDTTSTEVRAVYGDMYMKRKISGFTAGATKNFKAEDRRLINSIDVYQADAAHMVKLFAHRYITIAADTNHDLVGLDEEYFKVAHLRKPFMREIPRTGDATKGEILGEFTLETRHFNAGFWGKQHL